MTYVEGASLHQERAGSTVFARYAFNELVSFVAGWAILLDYIDPDRVTALSATHYLAAFWRRSGDEDGSSSLVALGIILYVAVRNVRGFSQHARRTGSRRSSSPTSRCRCCSSCSGSWPSSTSTCCCDPIDLGTTPTWSEVVFALGVATVVFTGLESAAGPVGRGGRRARAGSSGW